MTRTHHHEAMFRAADAYRRRFGQAAPTWQFMDRPADLARELRAAIRRGEPVTEAELYERLGMQQLPSGVEL